MKKVFLFSFLLAMFGALNAEPIYPITRENGSGTRGAFVEIFEVQKVISGKKVDNISKKAEVTNSTGVMIATIENSKNGIGYISLGSLNDKVKALKISGVSPSVENIQNKSYTISRPFNVVYKAKTPQIEDFLNYAINAQDVITKTGYIAVGNAKFNSKMPSGKLIIAGSSSVTPLMEKLAESYAKINPKLTIEILQSDSTTGVNSAVDGIADIGMVSREVKKTELDRGIKQEVLAIDGLAVIVHKTNKLNSISKEQVKAIFSGELMNWEDIK